MTLSFVIEPRCSFAEIGARLAELGFARDEAAPLTPDIVAGEPEPLGGRHLRESLFTLPVHSCLTARDLARLYRWLELPLNS